MKTKVLAATLAAATVASSSLTAVAQNVQQDVVVPPSQRTTLNPNAVNDRPVRGPYVTGPSVALDLLPASVQKTVRDYSMGATITDISKGTLQGEPVYQVNLVHGGTNVVLQVAENGGLVRNAINDQYLASVNKMPSANVGLPAAPLVVRDWATAPQRLPLGDATVVSLASLPDPARQTLQSYSGGANIGSVQQGTVGGRTVYQAELLPYGQKIDLRVDTNGVVLNDQVNDRFLADVAARQARAVGVGQPALGQSAQGGLSVAALPPLTDSTVVPPNQLPAAVKTTVGTRAANSTIQQVTRGTVGGKTVYDITYDQGGAPVTVRVGEDGSILTPETNAR